MSEENKATGVQRVDYIREQIKDRPINKKKLIKRTVGTASLAVLFGIVACLTLVILEPLLSRRLNPVEEENEVITLPPETVEVSPKDLPKDDEELTQNQVLEAAGLPSAGEDEEEENAQARVLEELLIGRDPMVDYSRSYEALQAVANEISGGLVNITSVTAGDNWLLGDVEASGRSTGAVVANTRRYFLILARTADVQKASSLSVTFKNGTVAPAAIRMSDDITGISILEASKEGLDPKAIEDIKPVELGNSNSSSLRGGPVIALGSPMGVNESLCYGTITSTGTPVQEVDARYGLIMTDIYGSQQASGFLANIQGQIIGVINQKYNSPDLRNLVSALGISELRSVIERLSNSRKQPYLGLTTADVSISINEELGIPFGAYVTRVSMDSPALKGGIQSGDVIVSMDGNALTSQAEYIDTLAKYHPEDRVELTIMRESGGSYFGMSTTVVLN